MKLQRHTAIRDLLVQSPVTNQDELRRKLAERGFHVTQATLSRDIHELRLSKGPTGYSLPAAEVEEDDLPGIRDVLRSFGLEVAAGRQLAGGDYGDGRRAAHRRRSGLRGLAGGRRHHRRRRYGADYLFPTKKRAGTLKLRMEESIG